MRICTGIVSLNNNRLFIFQFFRRDKANGVGGNFNRWNWLRSKRLFYCIILALAAENTTAAFPFSMFVRSSSSSAASFRHTMFSHLDVLSMYRTNILYYTATHYMCNLEICTWKYLLLYWRERKNNTRTSIRTTCILCVRASVCVCVRTWFSLNKFWWAM